MKDTIWKARLAQKGEVFRQKEIWKLCFGDPEDYIDFFYAKRYRTDQTAVLLQDGAIAAMLTMIPVQTILPDKRSLKTTMLYAIATHPDYQMRGLATRLMDFANGYLREHETKFTVLVPAEKGLFDFYRKQGYTEGFYLREVGFAWEKAKHLQAILPETGFYHVSALDPVEYNHRRNSLLQGRRYVAYADADVAYQKALSQRTGADIYGLDREDRLGCFAVERIAADKVLVKELLVTEDLLSPAVREIVRRLPAKEYFLRMPPHLGEQLGGVLRPFGAYRALGDEDDEMKPVKHPSDLGYLGFAFD